MFKFIRLKSYSSFFTVMIVYIILINVYIRSLGLMDDFNYTQLNFFNDGRSYFYFIDSDIKSNIAVEYDPDKINYERLNYAIKLSNCDEFINQFKNKLDTKVGERGSKLSGGQRQRIGIA